VAAWIKIGNVSVQPWALSLVYSQLEATKLSLADAREAVKAAQTHYANHLWAPAHISGDTYMVVGQESQRRESLKRFETDTAHRASLRLGVPRGRVTLFRALVRLFARCHYSPPVLLSA
jgi:hypothetical protein